MNRTCLVLIATLAVTAPTYAQPPAEFWTAVAGGDLAALERTLDGGASVDAREPNGATPLIVAAMFGQADLVRALIGRDASLDARNDDGASAVHVAALFAHSECLSLLLHAGASTALTNNDGLTALDMVLPPWSPEVEGLYGFLGSMFQIDLDMDRLQAERPKVRELLQTAH
jgi:ankyrin repeat protein